MPQRELTYADDIMTASPPDGPDADGPTPRDAGRVLADLWDRSNGHLPVCVAVERLREEFGGRFLCGPAGRHQPGQVAPPPAPSKGKRPRGGV